MAKKDKTAGKDNGGVDSPDHYINTALTGVGGDSCGELHINTGREVQWIKSAMAADNVGKGILPDRIGRSSIHADWGGKKLDVRDQDSFDHSIDKSRTGDHRAWSEEALRSVRAPKQIPTIIQHDVSHRLFSVDDDDED
jgi:hypothetical protein